MNLNIDFSLLVDDGEATHSSAVLNDAATFSALLAEPSSLEGRLTISFGGPNACDEFVEPIVRLIGDWLRKLPWIIGGDTETVALRNSEQCFAFVPAGESVEISFFNGTETEIEDYLFEPVTVRLDLFARQSLDMGERLLQLFEMGAAAQLQSNEDVKDLQTSLGEAKRAWRDYLLHNRR